MTEQAEMLDFSRSFLAFTTLDHGNTARIQIEGSCTLHALDSDTVSRYVMIASCKAEDTYGSGPLFLQPNYDFSGVFSESEFAIYRLLANAYDNRSESGPREHLFANIEITEVPLRSARMLADPAAIIQATHDGQRLAARTSFTALDDRYAVTLDYPAKTMNVNLARQLFQVDTGPLPFPVHASRGRLVDSFAPAYVAYQALDRAEFILLEAVPINGNAQVNHYAGTRTVTARTVLYAAE